MTLQYFSIALDSDDYLIPNEPDSEFPFSVSSIVSDFSFQSFYLSEFIQKRLIRERFKANSYNQIIIRGRKKEGKRLVFKKHLNSLNIEIPFDEKKYKELYPYKNKYPLLSLIKPVENDNLFSEFLISMVVEGMTKARDEKTEYLYDFIIDTTLDFKANGGKNEWVHQDKVFKAYDLKTILFCKLTANYFALEFLIEKNNKILFRKEILKTLPSEIQYGDEYKDVTIKDGKFIITKNIKKGSSLFTLPISELS